MEPKHPKSRVRALNLLVLGLASASVLYLILNFYPRTTINIRASLLMPRLNSSEIAFDLENFFSPKNASIDPSNLRRNETRKPHNRNMDEVEDPYLKKCPDAGRGLRLIIAVTSSTNHSKRRTAIRETWGQYATRENVTIVFLIGLSDDENTTQNLRAEKLAHQDIIQGNFYDSYSNLTLKSVLMLEWVKEYCFEADFLLKTDDDVFVNVPRLLAFLAQRSTTKRVIYGHVTKSGQPVRNVMSKYYLAIKEYRPRRFPNYVNGPAYLLPVRLAEELYAGAMDYGYLKMEDVLLTGVVAHRLKIDLEDVPGFRLKGPLYRMEVDKTISYHGVSPEQQYALWRASSGQRKFTVLRISSY